MSKKYKSLIITLVSVVVVVVTAVIFCFTLFTVKDIKLDFRTELTSEFSKAYKQEDIIEKSGIKTGSCVFFLKKHVFEENIEKNFPYLEVINVEIQIPSHIVVHLAERQEFYAVEHNGQTLFCDDEFKVLRVENWTGYSSTESNAIFIPQNQLSISNETIVAGDFLEFKQSGLKDLYNAMLINSRSRSQMIATIKEISVYEYAEKEVIVNGERVEKEWQTSIKLSMHSGREIYIGNIDYGFKYKLQKMYGILTSVMDIQSFKIKTETEEKVYDKAINPDETINILANAEIHVENYQSEFQYDEDTDSFYKKYSEKDCFYYLVYNGNVLST